MYICIVCGYNNLDEKQYFEDGSPTFSVCPCCGFESGFDDLMLGYTYESYRSEWIKKGAKWLMKDAKPDNWDIQNQLKNLKLFEGSQND